MISRSSIIHRALFSPSTALGAILLMFFVATPAHAFSVEDIIETAQSGNGTVVETHSSASTGGQTARSGETVTTGDSSVSSQTHTVINSNNSGGTVEVKVEKTVNGVTTVEERVEEIPAHAPIKVNVEAHANSAEPEASTTESNRVEVHIETAVENKPNFFTETVPEFFLKVISFFSWF